MSYLKYEHSMNWIEEEEFYGRLGGLTGKLAGYIRVQQRYKKGTEERKKLDREVYKLEKEIYEVSQQYINDLTEIQREANEKRAQLENDYYQDVANVQEEANKKRIELEEEYYEKTKEINDKLEEDIKSVDDTYKDALESRTKSLYNAYNLFDEVTSKKEVDGADLVRNLQDQIKEFDEWKSILNSLSAKGVNEALIEEFQEMGPKSIAELKALNKLSDSQLSQYVNLWSEKYQSAKDQATKELENMRIETQSQIANLRKTAAIELEEYQSTDG